MITPDLPMAWRKSSRSGGEGGNCIELAHAGAVRDSRNPDGPTLRVELAGMLAAVKAGHLDR